MKLISNKKFKRYYLNPKILIFFKKKKKGRFQTFKLKKMGTKSSNKLKRTDRL